MKTRGVGNVWNTSVSRDAKDVKIISSNKSSWTIVEVERRLRPDISLKLSLISEFAQICCLQLVSRLAVFYPTQGEGRGKTKRKG